MLTTSWNLFPHNFLSFNHSSFHDEAAVMKVSIHNDSVARNYFVSSVRHRQKVHYEKLNKA